MIELLPFCLALLGATPEVGAGAESGERTAVVVTLERRELPEIEAMQGWFLAGGQPRRVLAVDKGPAEVWVVRDPAVQDYLQQLAGAVLDRGILRARKTHNHPPGRLERGPHRVRIGEDTVLEIGTTRRGSQTLNSGEVDAARERLQQTCSPGDARVRFVSPMAAPVSRTGGQMGVFMQSESWHPGPRGFLDFVSKVPRLDFALRLHDAIWIAGHELGATGRRRAVMTWLEGRSRDESFHSPAAVAAALERLRVPHFVWGFGLGPLADAWGGPLVAAEAGVIDSAAALASLDQACAEVREALERQRVVWIEGTHPPAEIRLAAEAQGVRLAGGPSAGRPPGGRP